MLSSELPGETLVSGDGTTSRTFDRLDRLIGIDYSDATPDVTLVYDANGNRSSMSDGAGTETYAYDALDRMRTVTRGTDVFDYVYDADGNVSQRTYPDSTVVGATFDRDDRHTGVSVAANTVASYSYDSAGNLTRTAYPSGNGYAETRVYDRAGRVVEVRNIKGSNTLSITALVRDAVGNPTVWASTAGATTYAYDSLDRLSEACFTSGCGDYRRYTYDELGNRKTEARPAGTTTYTYNSADQLTGRSGYGGSVSYSFDPNGNQTGAGADTFTYDLANRLKTATVGATTTSYSYDGDGKRLQASTGALATQKTAYLWDAANPLPQLALERDGNGALRRRYINGLDLISMTVGAQDYFYHHDALGSIVNLTSATGATQWSYTYEPFGTTVTETQNASGAPMNLMRFTGELYDSDTSLYYLRARQYDPKTGRFLARDPLPAELNDPFVAAYVYVANRATILVDPSGQRGKLGLLTCAVRILFGFGECGGSETQTREQPPPQVDLCSLVICALGKAVTSFANWLTGPNILERVFKPKVGTIVYRVYGGYPPEFSSLYGRSWTPIDPLLAGKQFRNLAALPDENLSTFLAKGRIIDPRGIEVKPSSRYYSEKYQRRWIGGLPEYIVPLPATQVAIIHTSGVWPGTFGP